jgi:hypothetical protein
VEAQFFHVDRRKDRLTKLIVVFRNFPTRLKKLVFHGIKDKRAK